MGNKHDETRCQAHTKAGKPCRAAATAGGRCFFHANTNKAAELGRMGGLKNRHIVADAAVPALPPLDSAVAVRNAIAQVFSDLYAGRISPKVASSLASLLGLELRAIDLWDLVQEFEALKKMMAEWKPKASVDGKNETPALGGVVKCEPQDDFGKTETG